MPSPEATGIAVKYRLPLAMLGLIAAGISLLATYRYGAGLSHDSVEYVAAARHIAHGAGAVTFDGSPLVAWPRLYPALLATIDWAFAIDPLSSAPPESCRRVSTEYQRNIGTTKLKPA
jgi:hypothetical protein